MIKERTVASAPRISKQTSSSNETLGTAILLKRYKDKKVDRDWLNTNFPLHDGLSRSHQCGALCSAHCGRDDLRKLTSLPAIPIRWRASAAGFVLIPAKLRVVVEISIALSRYGLSSVF